MKTIDEWLNEYAESHQNSTNKLIHWICVPLIFFTIIGMLSLIPFGIVQEYFEEGFQAYIHAGSLLIFLGMLFYLRLSSPLAFGMLIISSFMLYFVKLINQGEYAFWIYLGIFIVAWVGQFIGHNIEGKKPSFFKDLQFLMIGPIWLLSFIYKKYNIRYS